MNHHHVMLKTVDVEFEAVQWFETVYLSRNAAKYINIELQKLASRTVQSLGYLLHPN